MRLANLAGRLAVLIGDGAVDVDRASGGRFPADPDALFDHWDEMLEWTRTVDIGPVVAFDPADLGPPVPRPRQVFAVALNYRPHAAEAGFVAPEVPLIFTKFPACITGPIGAIALPDGHVDWEVELVAVIGRAAHRVPEDRAWDVVAGLTIGQDLSERVLQLAGKPAQFSLAKSYPGFGPIGPALVSLDEVGDPHDLAISCQLNGETMQSARTSDMIFSVPALIAHISDVCPLFPGDLIFTGTPGGVGNRREPPLFIGPGDELVSGIETLGRMQHEFVKC